MTYAFAQARKSSRQKFPVTKLQLVQIGNARVPTINARTAVSYPIRQAFSSMHSGATYDHDRWYPPPLIRGEIEHGGTYRCYGTFECSQARDELNEIITAKSYRTRFLFYMWTDCPPLTDTANQRGDCGRWLWAEGRVVGMSNPFTVEEAYGSVTTELSIQAALDTPLREITYSKWRYGNSIAKLAETDIYTDTMEFNIAEAPALWWIPCGPPEQWEIKRFWMRSLFPLIDTVPGVFNFSQWESSATHTFGALSTNSIIVDGNAPPRARWIITWANLSPCIISVTNRLGSRDYSYNNIPQVLPYEQYRDSWLGGGYEFFGGSFFQPTASAAFTPLLAPGDNLIAIDGGHTVRLGIDYAWIN